MRQANQHPFAYFRMCALLGYRHGIWPNARFRFPRRSPDDPQVEPQIHSHHTDALPESHALAHRLVGCHRCGNLVHADTNECMETWLEWGAHILCGRCAAPLWRSGVLDFRRFKAIAEKRKWAVQAA